VDDLNACASGVTWSVSRPSETKNAMRQAFIAILEAFLPRQPLQPREPFLPLEPPLQPVPPPRSLRRESLPPPTRSHRAASHRAALARGRGDECFFRSSPLP